MLLLNELLIGAVLGIVISTTSVGGGVLALPLLSYLFKLDLLTTIATANFLSMLMKIPSTFMHYRLGNIPLQQSLLILVIMLPSTLIATYLLTVLSSVQSWQSTMKLVVNLAVILAILASLLMYLHSMFKKSILPSSPPPVRSALLPAVLTGVTLGTTGVGGGILVIPMLMKYVGFTIKEAIGSSVFITMILSGGAALAYHQGGYTDFKLAIILSLGSLLGIPIAAYLMATLSERFMQWLTLLLILVSIILMSYRLL